VFLFFLGHGTSRQLRRMESGPESLVLPLFLSFLFFCAIDVAFALRLHLLFLSCPSRARFLVPTPVFPIHVHTVCFPGKHLISRFFFKYELRAFSPSISSCGPLLSCHWGSSLRRWIHPPSSPLTRFFSKASFSKLRTRKRLFLSSPSCRKSLFYDPSFCSGFFL